LSGSFKGEVKDEQTCHFKGILGFLEDEEKMVVGTDNHHAFIAGGPDIFRPDQRGSALYLHAILNYVKDSINPAEL